MPVIAPESGTLDLSEVEPYVLPAAATAPIDVIEFNVRQAAIQFCERTLIWAEHLPELTTVANQEAYDIVRPQFSTVHKLTRATLNGCGLTIVPYSTGLLARQNLEASTGANTAFMDTINRVHLAPAPQVAGLEIYLDAVLVPSHDATTLPALLFPFLEALGFGALAKILLIKGDNYDPSLAAINAQLFKDAVSTAALRVSRGMSSAGIRGKRDPRSRFF